MVRGISRDKICILVTHHMDVAVMCDFVYALREGKLKLQGND